jgi:hypothetical protein
MIRHRSANNLRSIVTATVIDDEDLVCEIEMSQCPIGLGNDRRNASFFVVSGDNERKDSSFRFGPGDGSY